MKGRVEMHTEGPIATMVLSNPGKHNAITLSMWEDITRNCEELIKVAECASRYF